MNGTIKNMSEEQITDFFWNKTQICDGFYDDYEGEYRWELKPHIEPQNHTDEMFEGVHTYVPGLPYDIYLYETA